MTTRDKKLGWIAGSVVTIPCGSSSGPRFNSNTTKSNNKEFIGSNLTSTTLDYDSIRKLLEWVIKLKIGS